METREKLYTELAHEIIDNTIDDTLERITRVRHMSTTKTEVLAYMKIPHLTPTNHYNKRNNWCIPFY